MRIYKKCSRPRKEAVSRLYMRLQYRGERRITLDNRSVLHDCLCYLSSTLMAATWFSSRRGLSREATRYSSPTSLKVYSTWMAGSLSYDVLYVAFDTFTNILKQALTGAHGMRAAVELYIPKCRAKLRQRNLHEIKYEHRYISIWINGICILLRAPDQLHVLLKGYNCIHAYHVGN